MDGKVVEYINENGETKILRNISKIGEGSYGIVYKALLDGFGEVAVKYQFRLETQDIKSALLEYRKSHLLEKHSITVRKIIVKPSTKVSYPLLNIPEVSITTSNILHYKIIFIYDLVVGMELFEIINLQRKSGIPFTIPTLKHYISQMLEGLIEIRDAGVVHRDIKPENIMLHNGNIKFIDFGMICEIPKCRGMVGTPLFISPKVVNCEYSGNIPSETDWYNSDLYAIGITILNLLGDIPFENDSVNNVEIFGTQSLMESYDLVRSQITVILTREGYLNFAPLIFGLTAKNPIVLEEALRLTNNL